MNRSNAEEIEEFIKWFNENKPKKMFKITTYFDKKPSQVIVGNGEHVLLSPIDVQQVLAKE